MSSRNRRDRRGNASVFAYDEEGRVTAESNALGETTLHSYDSNGNELSTTELERRILNAKKAGPDGVRAEMTMIYKEIAQGVFP